MNNGKAVNYKTNEPLRVLTYRGWWKKLEELLVWPNDRFTAIPVQRPSHTNFLKRLWLKLAPDVWRRHLRLKKHQEYLRYFGIVDKKYAKYFGSEEHFLAEMTRVKGLPPVKWLPIDARRRTRIERAVQLRTQLQAEFAKYKDIPDAEPGAQQGEATASVPNRVGL